jgi:hypothetical protein
LQLLERTLVMQGMLVSLPSMPKKLLYLVVVPLQELAM